MKVNQTLRQTKFEHEQGKKKKNYHQNIHGRQSLNALHVTIHMVEKRTSLFDEIALCTTGSSVYQQSVIYIPDFVPRADLYIRISESRLQEYWIHLYHDYIPRKTLMYN